MSNPYELIDYAEKLWSEGYKLDYTSNDLNPRYPDYPKGGEIHGENIYGWFAPHEYQVREYTKKCERLDIHRDNATTYFLNLKLGAVPMPEKPVSSLEITKLTNQEE